MKNAIPMLTMILALSLTAQASRATSDDLRYCREVKSGGVLGQPAGVRNHCVTLGVKDGQGFLTDNANTFFGNPPETLPVQIKNISSEIKSEDGEVIGTVKTKWIVTYSNSEKGHYAYQFANGASQLINRAGAVLILQPIK